MVLLSYIGGKARIGQKILNAIPKDTVSLVSPFFGAGSVEFLCAHNGIVVVGYDVFPELVNFWQQLKLHQEKIADVVSSLLPMSKELFKQCRTEISDDALTQAVRFFVANKCCYNGIMSSSYSHTLGRHFMSTPGRIRKFVYPTNLFVHRQGFEETIRQHSSDFLFLDPPYFEINKTYGFRGEYSNIDHELLATLLESRTAKWLLVYNDHPYIRDRYKKFFITELVSRYSSITEGHQILIANYKL